MKLPNLVIHVVFQFEYVDLISWQVKKKVFNKPVVQATCYSLCKMSTISNFSPIQWFITSVVVRWLEMTVFELVQQVVYIHGELFWCLWVFLWPGFIE